MKIFFGRFFPVGYNIAKEYLDYKTVLDERQKKKPVKNKLMTVDDCDRGELDEIYHKFDRMNG